MSGGNSSVRVVALTVASTLLVLGIVAIDAPHLLTSVRDVIVIVVAWIVTSIGMVLVHVHGPVLTDRAGAATSEERDSATDSEPENGG